MQTKSLIQSSANVIRVINLKAGDIYKRYSDSSYDTSCFYGIVKRINNNGEKTFIESIEYKKSYNSISADFKVWGGDKEVDIFPTTLDEIQEEFGNVITMLEKEIEDKKKEIENKKKCIAETQLLLSGELSDKLQTAEFKEMTQGAYNALKQQKAALLEI